MAEFDGDGTRQRSDDDQEEVEVYPPGIPENYRIFARMKGRKIIGPFSVVGPNGPLGSFDNEAAAVGAAVDDSDSGPSFP